MSDIAAASEAAGAHADQPLVAVDNTLMGPTFQHPLTLGADLAVYSATKYLSGFSDMLAGVIRGKDPEIIQELRNGRNSSGVVGGAGVKTASHMDALWELLQAARTSENRIKTSNRAARRIQDQNQFPLLRRARRSFAGLLSTNRSATRHWSDAVAHGCRPAGDWLRLLLIQRNP